MLLFYILLFFINLQVFLKFCYLSKGSPLPQQKSRCKGTLVFTTNHCLFPADKLSNSRKSENLKKNIIISCL